MRQSMSVSVCGTGTDARVSSWQSSDPTPATRGYVGGRGGIWIYDSLIRDVADCAISAVESWYWWVRESSTADGVYTSRRVLRVCETLRSRNDFPLVGKPPCRWFPRVSLPLDSPPVTITLSDGNGRLLRSRFGVSKHETRLARLETVGSLVH